MGHGGQEEETAEEVTTVSSSRLKEPSVENRQFGSAAYSTKEKNRIPEVNVNYGGAT